MQRKKRDVRRAYRRAGFTERHGKGDHIVFTHPLLRDNFSVDGADGIGASAAATQSLKAGRAHERRQ
jgi:hypothetical protein